MMDFLIYKLSLSFLCISIVWVIISDVCHIIVNEHDKTRFHSNKGIDQLSNKCLIDRLVI